MARGQICFLPLIFFQIRMSNEQKGANHVHVSASHNGEALKGGHLLQISFLCKLSNLT